MPFPHFPNVHERQVKACHPGRCLKLAAALPNKTASKKQSTGIWDGTGKHSFRHFFSDCVCSILSNWPCAIGTLDIDQEKKTKSHVPPSHMHMMSKLGFFPLLPLLSPAICDNSLKISPRLTSGSTNLVQSRGKDRVKVEKRTEIDLKNTTERYK